MQLTPGQSRLEHIACIHGTFSFASTHHGMDLIDEDNGLSFILGQLIQDAFESLFKITPELSTSQKGCHVQGQNTLSF